MAYNNIGTNDNIPVWFWSVGFDAHPGLLEQVLTDYEVKDFKDL